MKYRRMALWAVLTAAYLIGYFHRVSPAVIVDRLFSDFSIEAAAVVGSMAAVYFYVYLLMQIPAGILTDVFGSRKVVFCGVSVAALGAALFGLAGTVSGLFAGRFLVGLGVSVIFVAVMRVYSNWFRPDEFGTYLGLTVSIGNLGGVLAATPLAALVDMFGWRASFMLMGAVSAAVAALAWVVVRDHPRELFSGGSNTAAGMAPVSWSDVYRGTVSIVSDRHLWLALTGSFSIYGPFMALVGVWGIPYLMQVYGLGRTGAASVILTASVGVMLGCVSLGFISDRVGSRKKPYIAFATGNALVWAALTWWNGGAPPLQGLVAICFLLGFFGNTGLLSPIMVREYNPPERAGLASGIGNMGGFAGSVFMQPFFGYLLDSRWEGTLVNGVKIYPPEAYQAAFAVCFLSGCLAVAAALLLRESLNPEINCRH